MKTENIIGLGQFPGMEVLQMPANKRITDLVDYTSVLPYASEIFGIYQPLIGWKSKRIKDRFNGGLSKDKTALLNIIKNKFNGVVEIKEDPNCGIDITIKPGVLKQGLFKPYDSVVLESISKMLPPYEQYRSEIWSDIVNERSLDSIFSEIVVPQYKEYFRTNCESNFANVLTRPDIARGATAETARDIFHKAFDQQLRYESALAGALIMLAGNNNHHELRNIFYSVKDAQNKALHILNVLSAVDAEDGYLNIENLNPRDKDHIKAVALSPISVVHLFRQYFFELDTFLGTPVGHVWLSPGSSVELVEVHTRKTITEKTLETSIETIHKSEKSVTEQDELSEAVKEDNKQDIKFGASVTASYASITATSSFDFNNTQQKAREENHKKMRQQTEKLSSEIRKNFKSTFKTITEVTDTSSKRYLLANSTDKLVNYELRKKMRQVGVQVQDIGTYLCWQTYVDDPGRDLGIAKLIHLAKPADLDSIAHPDAIVEPQAKSTNLVFGIPFKQTGGDGSAEKDEGYKHGREESEESVNEGAVETIQADFSLEGLMPPEPGYRLVGASYDPSGNVVQISIKGIRDADGETGDNCDKAPFKVDFHLDYVNFRDNDQIQVKFTLNWGAGPELINKVNTEHAAKVKEYDEKVKYETEKAFVDTARERVKLASRVVSRPSDELREEERIVVYRKLIQDFLSNGISMPDDRTRHIVAELINSIFDVDKMLYFVAPEWWRPRLHRSTQQIELAEEKSTPAYSTPIAYGVSKKILSKQKSLGKKPDTLRPSTVGWGGVQEAGRDNYYITEDSEYAKLGSSLGWLLQLDGDNMRNAFLNAPWVKAVMPIRPGMEEAAINWLKGVEGMNGIGDTDLYHTNNPNEKDINGNPLDGQKLIDVLFDLAKKIKKKHADGIAMGKYPKASEVADPALVDEGTTVTSTPIDRVYEHGFYPLKGGFKALVEGNYEICSQWIEVLPTDQMVPVEVTYDPKTGRQI